MVEAIQSHLNILLWLVPALPLLAGLVIAFLPDRMGKPAALLATAAQAAACLLALAVMTCALPRPLAGQDGMLTGRTITAPLTWMTIGDTPLKLGLLLDPMGAAMLAMVAFVALWIFIYSLGYMKDEARFGRFFGFLSLFSGAMLLVVLSNSLLLLFMAWEIVGLASYLLIGFYFEKPAAAAAAQKAFITTRVGDMAFFLGMIWLYRQTGTLLFYDVHGAGLLETGAITSLAGTTTIGGLAVSTMATLLLLGGAMGKSGQVPLHTWLPDAMEGPTPVSALIHAATMVAAGVFLVARTHPIFAAAADSSGLSVSLSATAWIGGITALFAALVAVTQSDIKRILAYSTVSQLGFMMVALGTGGVAAAMFHLIAHAFFKALLFLSAGSVIHGCHGEQDIRKMGGLAKAMPRTFACYAVGMMALAGFPFVTSGFWSKEAILHSAEFWPGGHGPFLLAASAALLTAFYMTRQALLVFFGKPRSPGVHHPHESPPVMLVPLVVLAAGAVLLALVGTPAWPWFESWLTGETVAWNPAVLKEPESLKLIGLSLVLFTAGVGAAWALYRRPSADSGAPDALESKLGPVWGFLRSGMAIDTLYDKVVIQGFAFVADIVDAVERRLFVPLMAAAERIFKGIGRGTLACDEHGLNKGFDGACGGLQAGARDAASLNSGRPQSALRAIGLGVSVLFFLYLWLAS